MVISNYKALLIEDNETHIDLIIDLLHEAKLINVSIEIAKDFQHASQLALTNKYDIVLLDLFLPDSNYKETLVKMSNIIKDTIPILVLTSLDDQKTIYGVIKEGASDCLPKSQLTTPILERTIIYCIDRHEKEQVLNKRNYEIERANKALIEGAKKYQLLNEELKKLSQAVEQSPTSIMITNVDGCIEYVNPSFLDQNGYTFEEVEGQNPRFLKSGKKSQEEYREMWQTITSGMVWHGEQQNKRKDGTYYSVFMKIAPLRNSEGKITHFVALQDDLSEIKKLEEEQLILREQLYHSQKLESMGRLAGGVAHDFNNILMAIVGYANLTELGLKDDDPAKEFVQKIIESSDKATRISQSLLAFSRKLPIKLEPVPLNKIIEGAGVFLLKITRESVSYKMNLTSQEGTIMADPDKLEQVIMNLATNAVDAMPDGGNLTICTDVVALDHETVKRYSLENAGAYGLISISDTGHGMDEETKRRVFEPYFTTKDRGKGTGIGLSIAYGIIKQHNGDINVVSEPEKGTTFQVYLPLAKATIKEAEKKFQNDMFVTPLTRTETILLAEDETSVREVVKLMLEYKGHKVISAVDGVDAIKKFEENKNDINMLLFDVMMPNMDGKAAYDAIIKIQPEVKVLFMSGYSEDVITNKAISAQNLLFLQKPVCPDILFGKVREILDV